MVLISLAGVNVLPSPDARTMLPQNPEFTRYELEFFTNAAGDTLSGMASYSFTKSITQLQLPVDIYYIRANGYNDNGEVPAARSGIVTVTVTGASLTPADFKLEPYIEDGVNGVLNFSLSWDSLARMPARAELFIEHYGDHDGNSLTDETWEPLAPSYIPQELRQTGPGTILLVNKAAAFINLNGSLSLPPGEYRLTMTLTMDEGVSEVSRFDIAQVYSNLTTPAAFHYGGGDFLLSNTSPDPGAAFITGFTFTETPNATTVIGSQPGADGTRLIMIMVPADADLKADPLAPPGTTGLTPVVVCADGSSITSPVPSTQPSTLIPNPPYTKGEIDFTNPTIWTAQARNGAIQRYTVVVTTVSDTDCLITEFSFKDVLNSKAVIDQTSGTINVVVPYGTKAISTYDGMIPLFGYIGNRVVDDRDINTSLTSGSSTLVPFNPNDLVIRVYANGGTTLYKDYEVLVTEALDDTAAITFFSIEDYPGIQLTEGAGIDSVPLVGIIDGHEKLPYGVSRMNLKPVIRYEGLSIDPAPGTPQNFNAPVLYTVTALDGSTKKTYQVTLTNKAAETNTGIFDFVITQLTIKPIAEIPGDPPVPAVPAKTYTGNTPAKVVIGQKPRADGKIPIVIQVPFNTDDYNLIPAITLSSSSAVINPNPPGTGSASGVPIPFGNAGNSQEAVYTVTAQDPTVKQDYVVVVSAGGQYLYVNGITGADGADYYQGMTEDRPYKTLAKAVSRASESGSTINHIFVSGELNADTEANSPLNTDSGSVITLDPLTLGKEWGEIKKITITGLGGGATFRGTTGKRVLSVTNGADLVFENITVTGGNTSGNGGGIYIGGDNINGYSKVKFSGGSITGNTAAGSGGGVYIEGSGAVDANSASEFTLENASITGNTALGTSTTLASLAGGGGVCVS
jgi:hypothetical protein